MRSNRLTATTGAMTITATYDRLNRVLTVDDEDAGSTADTTYTYSLASPAWSDPTGSYTATLDRSDRATATTTPATGSWAWTYGATGQVTGITQGNGNTLTSVFDATGRELTRTTRTGTTDRAAYTWVYNRAGLVLSEASTITGDPSNGTIAYAYDPLGRLTGAGSTAYTWDAAANRTGAGAATTAFDAANRPVSGTTPAAAYTSDADGRLTARPGQTMAWDHLGRLASVTTASGTTTYAYDPLDRLRTVSVPGGAVTRFRYTGLTTAAAQLIDDTSGTVTRDIANGWGAERLADWDPALGAGSARTYGTNAHHDTTWLAKDDGTVLSSLRYDPWGVPRSTPAAGYTPFRFQGSWHDTGTDLAWVVTRWYAPALGTFISEDSLLGQPRDPDSRHLYAYAQGEPVGSWDPDGRFWRRVLLGESLSSISLKVLGAPGVGRLRGANPGRVTPRNLSANVAVRTGDCIWIPIKNHMRPWSCNPYSGIKYESYSDALYRDFDGVVSFIYEQMVANRADRAGGVGQWSDCAMYFAWCYPFNMGVMAAFAAQVNENCPWDYKPDIRHTFGSRFAVRGDLAPEMLFLDVFANIHYGYVGRAHKIPAGVLREEAVQFGGADTVSDRVSVDIGIKLWEYAGLTLTKKDIADAVLRNMQTFRNDDASQYSEVWRGLWR